MRCADEKGWPERTFIATDDEGNDWLCEHCGWMQIAFPNGCRELVMAGTWHNIPALIEYLQEVDKAGLTLQGEITVLVDEDALAAARKERLPMSVDEARAVKREPIEVGKDYEFYAEMQQDYDPPENRMRNYTGQKVTVVRALRGQNEPDPETDWFEPYEENGELIEPEVSKGFVVRANDGFEFHALEEELDGWDRDLGQFFWPDGTHGWDHDTRFLVNEQSNEAASDEGERAPDHFYRGGPPNPDYLDGVQKND
jgi:hypothetical protein